MKFRLSLTTWLSAGYWSRCVARGACSLQRQLAEDARFKQVQGAIENAEDHATSEEPEWFKDFDDRSRYKLGNGGTDALRVIDFQPRRTNPLRHRPAKAERVAAEGQAG